MDAPTNRLVRLAESPAFNNAAIAVVVVNAILIGVQTYNPQAAWLEKGLDLIVFVFIAELIVRFLGRRSTRAFFADGWNIFDLVLIIAAFLPETGGLAPIVRVLRVFRVFRLVRTIPELRMIVTVLGRSIVSMKWIGLLALICFYVFAIAGYKLFGPPAAKTTALPAGAAAPANWPQQEFATLHDSLFTLFRILTQDNWTDLAYQAMGVKGFWFVSIFYVSWIIIATFVLINLVVGAIINNYQQVQDIEKHRHAAKEATDERIEELVAELNRLLQARKAGRDSGNEPHGA